MLESSVLLDNTLQASKLQSVAPTSTITVSLKHEAKKIKEKYEWQIVWRNVLIFTYMYIGGIYGLYLQLTEAHLATTLCTWIGGYLASIGVTVGAHRLWAHRSFKARWPLRLLLALLQTICLQNHIYEWVRDHRVHHKFTETDADPHNARRGFFFSHVGWLMVRKQKDVFEKGVTIDLTDLEKDPIVMFQKRNYLIIMPIFSIIIPFYIPILCWGENAWTSWFVLVVSRLVLTLNVTWLINSAAHMWGNKPFDKNIGAVDNTTVAILASGEGWHNYHHVFPWDYKAAELSSLCSISTVFIHICAKFGLAYDLKTVSNEMIRNRILRTGDGSHPWSEELKSKVEDHSYLENPVWGWEDKDMPEEEKKYAEISFVKSN